ncbi:hypothetical protein [uncultured Ellagibacter sp.]|uniref:hypothetical protein n=1 Tax=uncultured Ellagibacter sp. TaxID=2137580 RepID=UPI0026347FCA|nr:hypothetical protein [uncultured Ellagibacter sp.]
MDRQTTIADTEDSSLRRSTKREAFLEAMDAAIPWGELVAAAVEPFYYPGKRGRRPMGVEKMLRMYFLQLWFCYTDSGYTDVVKRPEVAGGPALAEVEWVVAEKPSRIRGMRGLAWGFAGTKCKDRGRSAKGGRPRKALKRKLRA